MSNFKKLTSTVVAWLLVSVSSIAYTQSAQADTVSLGDYTGTLTNTVTSGFSVRVTDPNCKYLFGRVMAASPFDATGTDQALGNGGCSQQYTDSYGNLSTPNSLPGVNADDGNANWKGGDLIDATQSISTSLDVSNSNGVGINISGIMTYNPLLDFNTPQLTSFTSDQEDELNNDFVLGNAYLTAGSQQGDTYVDFTLGKYVESLGTTAFLPIGVNVVNPIDLSLLRAPGVSIKDALIPQEMIGAAISGPSGPTLNVYYQLKQREIELDTSGTFWGSDVLGTGNQGILRTPRYRQRTGDFYGDAYYDFSSTDCDLVDGNGAAPSADLLGAHVLGGGNSYTYLLNFSCTRTAGGDARTALVMGSTDAETTINTWASGVAAQLPSALAPIASTLSATASSLEDGTYTQAWGSAVSGADIMDGNSGAAMGLTDADIINGLTMFGSDGRAVDSRRATIHLVQAPDKLAKDSGQFGFNLTGYADVGAGIDWGVYFSNYHSKAPYVQMLPIRGFNAVDLHTLMSDTLASGGLTTVGIMTSALTNTSDQINANFKYGAEAVAYQAANGVAGASTRAEKDAIIGLMDTNGVQDQGKAYAIYAIAGMDAAMGSAAKNAMTALQPLDRTLYQTYYPEDIQVFGISGSTVLPNGTAVAAEVAYRPDFPLQISLGDQIPNILDSTGGTAVQSFTVLATVAASSTVQGLFSNSGAAFASAYSDAKNVKWSGMADCDISSSGVASTVVGYNECVGHKEDDVWTFDFNATKTFTASHPYTLGAGADSAYVFFELGGVSVPDIDNTSGGVVSSGRWSIGNGYCDGVPGNRATYEAFALFKNGLLGDNYCSTEPGADDLAMSYRLRTGFTYNNVRNSPYTMNLNLGLNHDFSGNAPSSIGGFIEDRMRATLGLAFSRGDYNIKLDYIEELGNEKSNMRMDRDYLSYSMSYAF